MKKILLYIVLIMAVGMAGIVAYVSVSGLLKVFAGAGTLGLLLFSSIEISKIVATSAIHTYGKKIGWFYNSLLTLGIVIAMAITSMGIYGFLSSTYKESFSQLENNTSQVELLETKRNGYREQLDTYTAEKTQINKAVADLRKGLSNNVIQYKDPETGEIITTTSSRTRRALEKQLDKAMERQVVINDRADGLTDKVFDLENDILEMKLGNDAANELGPLKYLADVTGMTMDAVMKWFILLLIIIGDPMAILMVIVFNKVINYEDDDIPNIPITTPNGISNVGVSTGVHNGPPVVTGDKPIIDPITGHIDLLYKADWDDRDYWIGSRGEEVEPVDEIAELLNGKSITPKTGIDFSYISMDPNEDIHSEPIIEEEPAEEPMIELPRQSPPEIIVEERANESDARVFEELPEAEEIEPEPVDEVEYVSPSEANNERLIETIEQLEDSEEHLPIQREEIKEIKQGTRGYSVNVPQPKNNIERVGQNKYIKNDDGKVIYKRAE